MRMRQWTIKQPAGNSQQLATHTRKQSLQLWETCSRLKSERATKMTGERQEVGSDSARLLYLRPLSASHESEKREKVAAVFHIEYRWNRCAIMRRVIQTNVPDTTAARCSVQNQHVVSNGSTCFPAIVFVSISVISLQLSPTEATHRPTSQHPPANTDRRKSACKTKASRPQHCIERERCSVSISPNTKLK